MGFETGEYHVAAAPDETFAHVQDYFRNNRAPHARYVWQASFPEFNMQRSAVPNAWNPFRLTGFNAHGTLTSDAGGSRIRYWASSVPVPTRAFLRWSLLMSIPACLAMIAIITMDPSDISMWIAMPVVVSFLVGWMMWINGSMIQDAIFKEDLANFRGMMDACLKLLSKQPLSIKDARS